MSMPLNMCDPNAGKRPLKITIVGDESAEKLSFMKSYVQDKIPDYPSDEEVFSIYCKTEKVDGGEFALKLWYITGLDSYNTVRTVGYNDTDCFIVCYAGDDETSYANVEAVWIPELRLQSPETPILIVETRNYSLPLKPSKSRWSTQSQNSTKIRGKFLKTDDNTYGPIRSIKGCLGAREVFLESIRMVLKNEKKLQEGEDGHSSCKCT